MQLEVSFRQIAGTGAATGWAGAKCVVADRRAGSAGGLGIGFSGGELLALALGGGYFNQLHFSADHLGIGIRMAEIDVMVEFEGDPLIAVSADISVRLEVDGDAAARARLLDHARSESTISNSLSRGLPVTVSST